MTRKTQKKLRKLLTLVSCAVLLVCVTVVGTVAYLTSTTKTVTNTFTVGKGIDITLTEAPVGTNGKKTTGDRVTGNSYKLVPGYEYDKDPTVFVGSTSGDCYLFVKVENGIVDIEDDTADTIAEQMTKNGWVQIATDSKIWCLMTAGAEGAADTKTVCKAGDEKVVFEKFTTEDSLTKIESTYADAEVVVTAYAVQTDGFESNTPAKIWNTVFAASQTSAA